MALSINGDRPKKQMGIYFSFLLILSLTYPTTRMVEPKQVNDNMAETGMTVLNLFVICHLRSKKTGKFVDLPTKLDNSEKLR